MKPEPVAYRRFWRDGVPVDRHLNPISGAACKALARIWVRRLHTGAFSRIEFVMSDETRVAIKALPKAVRVDPESGLMVWGARGRRVWNPPSGAYAVQDGAGTMYIAPDIAFRLADGGSGSGSLVSLRAKINGGRFDSPVFPSHLFEVDPPMNTLATEDAA